MNLSLGLGPVRSRCARPLVGSTLSQLTTIARERRQRLRRVRHRSGSWRWSGATGTAPSSPSTGTRSKSSSPRTRRGSRGRGGIRTAARRGYLGRLADRRIDDSLRRLRRFLKRPGSTPRRRTARTPHPRRPRPRSRPVLRNYSCGPVFTIREIRSRSPGMRPRLVCTDHLFREHLYQRPLGC